MRGVRITKRFVDGLKPDPAHEFYWDTDPRGFGVRVQPSGVKSYVVKYRAGKGRSAPVRRITLGAVGQLTPEEARTKARKTLGAVAHGADPAKRGDTFQSIAEEYFKRECAMKLDKDGRASFEGGKLRSANQSRAMLKRLVYPKLGNAPMDRIRRSDIVRLLDAIDENNGPSMADYVLAVIRRIMSWHASRSDDYYSPIVAGYGADESEGPRP